MEPELVFLPMPGLDESVARARRLPVRANNRSLIVGAQGLVYAAMDEGTILMVTSQFEAPSNYRTIEELQSNLGPNFFCAFIVLFWSTLQNKRGDPLV